MPKSKDTEWKPVIEAITKVCVIILGVYVFTMDYNLGAFIILIGLLLLILHK